MAVGEQATAAFVNQILTQYTLAIRNDLQNILNLNAFVAGLETAGLEGIGFTPTDAATVQTMISYLNTVAEVFFGTGTQASAFDFDTALASLMAGQ